MQLIDDAGCASVADPQSTLQERRGAQLMLNAGFRCTAKQRISIFVSAFANSSADSARNGWSIIEFQLVLHRTAAVGNSRVE